MTFKMKMNSLFKNFCLFICLLTVAPVLSARQQVTPTPANSVVKQRMSNMKQQLDFLNDVAKQYPNNKLKFLIRRAKNHLKNAYTAYQQKKIKLSANEANAAQKLIDEALKLVSTGAVTRLLEQVNDAIRLAENTLHRNFNPQAQKVLENAKQSRKRALSLKNKNVQKMVEWLRLALFQAKNALKILQPSAAKVNLMSAVHEEKSNFNDLLRRSRDMLKQNQLSLAQQLFNQAIAQRKKAEEAMARGNRQQAVEAYRWASRLLFRVIDLTGASEVNWQRRATEELQLTRSLLQSVEQSVDLAKHANLQKLFRQSTKVYLDAENSLSRQNFPEAVRKAELSRRILNRAKQLADRSRNQSGFEFPQEYDAVRSLLDQLQQQFEPRQNPTAARVMEAARKYLELSSQQKRANRQFMARAYLFLATRFAHGLQNMLQKNQPVDNVREKALAQYRSFKDQYSQLQQQAGNSSGAEIQVWLNLAHDLLNIADAAYANGQYAVLLLNTRVGLQILKRIKP